MWAIHFFTNFEGTTESGRIVIDFVWYIDYFLMKLRLPLQLQLISKKHDCTADRIDSGRVRTKVMFTPTVAPSTGKCNDYLVQKSIAGVTSIRFYLISPVFFYLKLELPFI